MGVQIKILGPWEVTADGAVLKLAGARRAGVLARLALNVGQVVTTERILADVWGGSSAATAGKQLHIVVSKLRETLPGEVISTVPGGYRLDLPPEAVDAHRFSLLVRQARATRDRTTAIGLYERALALWRGAALEGRSEAWAQIEAARLEEERLVAVEDFTDLRLAAGDHRAVVGELTAHIDAHPLRERPRAQLMLALYRAARPAEALAVYRDTRGVMVDELGIEPGPTLRRLQQLVLTRSPVLDLAPADDQGAAAVIPAELPADPRTFTARSSEFAWMEKTLAVLPAVAAINGPGGIGKSALAIHAAHAASGRFDDGVLYIDLRGATSGLQPMTPSEALGQLLRSLGLDGAAVPSEVEEAAARYRSLTATRRLLIVLDNALDARQVRLLIPAGPTCAAIVTSRQALLTLDSAEHLQLDELDLHDATTLLARIADPARVQREPEAADQIVRLCGGLPLAIRVAAARLAARPDWTLAYLARQLADATGRLDALQYADLEVRAAIAVSHHHLREEPSGHDAAHLFTLLGLLEMPTVTPGVAAALTDGSEQHAEGVLDHLLDARLLESAGPGHYRMHDLVRLYAREQAIRDLPETRRAAAVRRALHHYLATAQTAVLLIDPSLDQGMADHPTDQPGLRLRTTTEAGEWIAAERDNLVAAFDQAAADPGHLDTAVGLSIAIHWAFWPTGWLAEVAGVHVRALGLVEGGDDWVGQAQGHSNVGSIYQEQGRFAESVQHLEQALLCWNRAGLPRRAAGTYNDLGITLTMMGRFDDALTALAHGLALTEETGRRDHAAYVRSNRVHVFYRQGRHDEAIAEAHAALDLLTGVDNQSGEATLIDTLADAYRAAGRLTEAEENYRVAIEIQHTLGYHLGEAVSCWWLGQTLYDLGRHEDARQSWHRSLRLLEGARLLMPDEVDRALAQPVPDMPIPIRNQL